MTQRAANLDEATRMALKEEFGSTPAVVVRLREATGDDEGVSIVGEDTIVGPFVQMVRRIDGAVPNAEWIVERVVSRDDMSLLYLRVRGKRSGSGEQDGEPVELRAVFLARSDSGVANHLWCAADAAPLQHRGADSQSLA